LRPASTGGNWFRCALCWLPLCSSLIDQDDINFISMLWQAAEKLAKADSSPLKRFGMTKNTGLYGTSKFVPFSNTFQTRVFPQPPRQTWRPAFAIAAATYPAGRCSNTPGGPPRANLSNCNERNRCHACQFRHAGIVVRINADHLPCLR